jgi:hypothetical protein
MLLWKRLGLVFDVRGRAPWMHSHGQNPNAVLLSDRVRIFFTCRPPRDDDGACVSYIGYADFLLNDLTQVIGVSADPVLALGAVGTFDEFGTMPGSVVEVPERQEHWMYYVGWQRSSPTPYRWAIGLAVSTDGAKTFQRISDGPLLGVDRFDPFLLACPRVWRTADGKWHMHYQSGQGWSEIDSHWESVYLARYASSSDGIHWTRETSNCVPTIVAKECQTSSSIFSIKGAPGRYQMLFSWRHGIDFRNAERGYRIGFAWSDDLKHWNRDDSLAGLQPSVAGFDNEMLCYPHVVRIGSDIFVFYCGNDFGADGFGCAKVTGWSSQ